MTAEHVPATQPRVHPAASELLTRFKQTRVFSQEICRSLQKEDYVVQSMDDASPAKWHLAHTTWFFETFLLRPHDAAYQTPNEMYNYLFNSYYNAVGPQYHRPARGLISRPTVDEVMDFRRHVDTHMCALLENADEALIDQIAYVIEVGINHEQQHQELMLTDIKHVFSMNPLRPALIDGAPVESGAAPPLGWVDHEGGVREIGHAGNEFGYDNEFPRHRVFLEPFRLATRLITNGEFKAFMDDGGYSRPELWLSEGWATVQSREWESPMYWERKDGRWWLMTLSGMREVNDAEPVCHVSYFEADAYARWRGCRLATEAEWEVVAEAHEVHGNFVDERRFHPSRAADTGGVSQLFGDVWEWTMSHYSPYPGYTPPDGALGEYNGKFMCNQFVLRGGSCATSRNHLRKTYRNFFPADARWQFSGIRLADGR